MLEEKVISMLILFILISVWLNISLHLFLENVIYYSLILICFTWDGFDVFLNSILWIKKDLLYRYKDINIKFPNKIGVSYVLMETFVYKIFSEMKMTG